VDDTALVLAAINGFDPRDEGSIDAPFGWDATRNAVGLRVGYVESDFSEDFDIAALDAVRGLGAAVIPLRLPDLPYEALRLLSAAESAAAFEELTLENLDDSLTRQDADAWPNRFRKARLLSAVDHVQLERLRRFVMQQMDALFRQVDVMVAPAMTGPMMVIGNMTGHPCLTLRTGFAEHRTRPRAGSQPAPDADGRMHRVPHAITIVAPLFDEAAALTLGRALEARLGVAGERPPALPA
jgi:Asp-tRNA(Asn)/Glu-tRNA(Gln) amidotransferase A subunit family amidase